MQRVFLWLIAFAGLIGLALIIYNALGPPEREVVVHRPPLPKPLPPAVPAEPQIRHPVPEQPAEKPLPALDESDATLKNSLAELLPDRALLKLPVLKDFVRHVVVTIDNLPRRAAAPRLWPLRPPTGQFTVSGNDEHATIAADNYARYTIYVRLAEAIDSARLVALYYHYYPLFQEAYRELGYPKGHFNDRVVEVIDHLLATPDLEGPVALVRPKVFYQFADPQLESRSAGQKILIRAGAENARRIKSKLQEIRDEIANRSRPSELQ